MKAFIDANLLIYLNTISELAARSIYEDFFIDLARKYRLYADDLVLDELLYISKKKYGVPYEITFEFIDSIVMPYITVIPLGEEEFNEAREIILKYNLRPSDALHVGAMRSNGIKVIASEDTDFDKVDGITRIWIPKA